MNAIRDYSLLLASRTASPEPPCFEPAKLKGHVDAQKKLTGEKVELGDLEEIKYDRGGTETPGTGTRCMVFMGSHKRLSDRESQCHRVKWRPKRTVCGCIVIR